MFYDEDEISGKRPRSQKKILRVTFPDGTVYCYKSATITFTETLRKLGADRVAALNIEWRHNVLCSKEPIPGYEQYMKPLDNGWLVNIQSDTSEKFLLLKSITTKLEEDCTIELGEDFETTRAKGFVKAKQKVGGLLIQFADGEFVGGESPKDSYIQAITKIGVDTVCYKGFENRGQELVTRYNKYKGQVQSGDKWITIPGQTKDKILALQRISMKLNLGLKITVID